MYQSIACGKAAFFFFVGGSFKKLCRSMCVAGGSIAAAMAVGFLDACEKTPGTLRIFVVQISVAGGFVNILIINNMTVGLIGQLPTRKNARWRFSLFLDFHFQPGYETCVQLTIRCTEERSARGASVQINCSDICRGTIHDIGHQSIACEP